MWSSLASATCGARSTRGGRPDSHHPRGRLCPADSAAVRPWPGRPRRVLAGASLRARVMAAAAILVALTSLVTGLLGTALLRSYLYGRADAQLRDFAVVASRVLEHRTCPFGQVVEQALPTQFLVEVVSADGQVRRRRHRCTMPTPRGCPRRSSRTWEARLPRRRPARPGTPGVSWSSRSPAAGTRSSPSASTIWQHRHPAGDSGRAGRGDRPRGAGRHRAAAGARQPGTAQPDRGDGRGDRGR